ncbi:MAG: sel1 repeat family protein [Candidatus Methanoplasma sp.]|jgi:TPR repeat protein|nr:sel1 repeat family protein [Candidatus Methanoplasma sp.]
MRSGGFLFETDGGSFDIDIGDVEKLAGSGDPDGLYAMGMAYLFGWEVEEDRERGFKLLEAASEKGQPDAMTLLVRLFMSHDYLMDIKKAVEYSMNGAEAGISDAQLFLGIAYMDGVGVGRDYAKAAELFRKSARQGNSEARNSLAFMYQEGLGVEKDGGKAFKLYKNAASAGNINAQYQTGAYYEGGISVKADMKKAAEWYGKAAESGDTFAMERLGIIYNHGSSELPSDPEMSFKWFLDAALGGMLGAMCYVGLYYMDGFGTEKDEEEGMKWLRLASSSGSKEADELLSKWGEGISGGRERHRT